MKNLIVLLLVLAPLYLMGQTYNSVDITFTFANGHITHEGSNQFYEFDIMIHGSDVGTNFSFLQVFLIYNADAFGEAVWTNGNLSFSLGALPLAGNYSVNQNDNSPNIVSLGLFWNWVDAVPLPTTPGQLFHVKMKIADPNQTTGLAFDADKMDLNQFDDQFNWYRSMIVDDTLDETLPVELSSFTASLNYTNRVTLQWITQSETNVSGYRIYRSSEPDLLSATMLNVFIPGTNTSQLQVYVFTDEDINQDGIYYYWLENMDMDGSSTLYGPVSISLSITYTGSPDIPLRPGIFKVYPNPFHPVATLSLSVDKNSWVDVDIYNLKGQKVRSLYAGNMDKGSKSVLWDGKDSQGNNCSNGIYLALMRADGKALSINKLILAK